MKDVLQHALDSREGDVIVWTNDDVTFTDGGLEQITTHASKWDFGCVRRSANHIGRDCFWFRRGWLADHFVSMPDVVLSAPACDLVIAKWLRKMRGLPHDLESMNYDYPPVDYPPGIIYHEYHESSWLPHQTSPSARHNEELFRTL
jgi:hypothetical protein